MKPTPNDEFYDFLADEMIAYLIANQDFNDFDGVLHSESVMAFKSTDTIRFPMKWEKVC